MSINKFRKILLIAGDVLVLYLSLYITLVIRYQQDLSTELWQIHLSSFSFIFLIWIIIFYISNLYSLNIAVSNFNFFKKLGKGLLTGILFAVLFFYTFSAYGIAPKTNLAIFILVFAILIFIWRQIFNWSLSSYLPKNNIAIIGQTGLVREIIAVFKTSPHLGQRISFVLDQNNQGQREINGVPVLANINELEQLIRQNRINSIVLAQNPNDSDKLRSVLFRCLPFNISFIKLPNFYENITGRVPLDEISKMWFLENLNEGNKQLFNIIKRLADISLAVIIFILTLPLWLIIAIIIKLESKGPVFFLQTRAGQKEKLFKIIKFRTMVVNGNNHEPTTREDKRITGFGNFLRKSRLDEIPQVLNIIKGDMSFIGPRPERPSLIKSLQASIPFYTERMLVKPGITGWDQVCGEYHSPSLEDTIKKLQYDLFYIKNRSILLDLSIILKTINTVLSKTGR